MAKGGDRKQKQEKRAREELDKALRRGDAALLLEVSGDLSEADRAAEAPRVAALVRSAVSTWKRTGKWAELARAAARVEALPSLIEAGAKPAEAGQAGEADEARWALVWACARQRDLGRASRLWAPLSPKAPPALQAAASALLSGKDPGAEAAGKLGVAEAPSAEAHKGPLPADEKALEEQLLALYGSEPWASFWAAVERWRKQLSPPLARAALVLGARLAVRSALDGVSSGNPSAGEPLSSLAEAARALGPEPSFEPLLATGLRLALAEARAASPRRSLTSALPALGSALVAYPGRAAEVAPVLGRVPARLLPSREALSLAEKLLASHPSPSLWALAASAWLSLDQNKMKVVPPQLGPLVVSMTRLGPGLMSPEVVASLDDETRVSALTVYGRVAPPGEIERAFQGYFPRATKAGRKALAEMLGGLMGRAGSVVAASMRQQFGPMLEADPETAAMIEALSTGGGAQSAEAERVLRTLAPLVIDQNEELFEILVSTSKDDDEVHRLLEGFLAGAERLDDWMVAIEIVDVAGRAQLAAATLERAMGRFREETEQLGEAVVGALMGQAPRFVVASLAKALSAAPLPPDGERSATLRQALTVAQMFSALSPRLEAIEQGVLGEQSPEGGAEAQAPETALARRRRARQKRQAEQLSLGLTEPTPPPPRAGEAKGDEEEK